MTAATDTKRSVARVLVVDDEPNIRKILGQALGDAGYEVCTAADGYEAIRQARETQPDLILLDLMLPGLDGQTFLDIYRRAPGPKAPVVVITAARPAGLELEEELGAAVVHKPFSVDRLLEVIRRHLELA